MKTATNSWKICHFFYSEGQMVSETEAENLLCQAQEYNVVIQETPRNDWNPKQTQKQKHGSSTKNGNGRRMQKQKKETKHSVKHRSHRHVLNL